MRTAPPGIAGHLAPDWNVATWFNLPPDTDALTLTAISKPVVYLYCFQAWCPGCHSHGFPTMATVRQQVDPADVAFVAVQTVFEGHEVNTPERAQSSALEHGLDDIPVGHDPGVAGGPPDLMRSYRTGGTPWTVIIGPERRVCFDGFQITPDVATTLIGQLLR